MGVCCSETGAVHQLRGCALMYSEVCRTSHACVPNIPVGRSHLAREGTDTSRSVLSSHGPELLSVDSYRVMLGLHITQCDAL